MCGNVTALEGLHVIREIQELEYDARMLQAGNDSGDEAELASLTKCGAVEAGSGRHGEGGGRGAT